eukprot:5816178-Prymnesium_polylepis.1
MQHERRRRVVRAAVWPRCGDARCRIPRRRPWRRRRDRRAHRASPLFTTSSAASQPDHVAFIWYPSSQDTERCPQLSRTPAGTTNARGR